MEHGEDPFELFLSLLSHDRDEAEKKFKTVRRRLIVLMDLRGCTASEEVVDEAILRFVNHLAARNEPFVGDPVAYVHTIAQNLHLVLIDKAFLPLPDDASELPQPEPEADVEEDRLHDCLDKCLNKMEQKGREIVLEYYSTNEQAKIVRKTLARRLKVTENALRIRIYHLKKALQLCIEECLGLKPPAEME